MILKYLAPALIFLNLAIPSLAQNDPLKAIRAQFSAIESNKNLAKSVIKTEALGGEFHLTKYTDNKGKLKKLTFSYGSDHSSIDQTFYYQDDIVFFLLETEYSWRFIPGKNPDTPETLDKAAQYRVYFHNQKAFKVLEKKVESKEGEKIDALLTKAPNKPLQPSNSHTQKQTLGQVLPLISSVTLSAGLQ